MCCWWSHTRVKLQLLQHALEHFFRQFLPFLSIVVFQVVIFSWLCCPVAKILRMDGSFCLYRDPNWLEIPPGSSLGYPPLAWEKVYLADTLLSKLHVFSGRALACIGSLPLKFVHILLYLEYYYCTCGQLYCGLLIAGSDSILECLLCDYHFSAVLCNTWSGFIIT